VPAYGLPQYSIAPIGLADVEHTRDDGYQFSDVRELNESGQAYGLAKRYNGGGTELGESVWLYDGETTHQIGFIDPVHTRSDGFQRSWVSDFNEAGQVAGRTARYNGGSDLAGFSAWLSNGSSMVEIGLTDDEHASDGWQQNWPSILNDAGTVIGTASRYPSGNTYLGRSAWLHDGATVRIGLTGPEFTRDDGYQSSIPIELNDARQVIGDSVRYSGSTTFGQSSWFFNGTATVEIGLMDAEHIGADGLRSNAVAKLNSSGHVLGVTRRYHGGTEDLGVSIWLYDGITTVNIGLTGIEHTAADGRKRSTMFVGPGRWNEAGQAIGFAERYNGGSEDLGLSAWLYNGATTVEIGLFDAEHTSSGGQYAAGHQRNNADEINAAGQVRGNAYRFTGGNLSGWSAWFYDGTTTHRIGLVGAEYIGSDGSEDSTSIALNEAGKVAGWSNRFNGSAYHGRRAWLYDGVTTLAIGLVGIEHTRNDGFLDNRPTFLNEAGQVGGYSLRYSGGSELGQDAWFFDPALNQTFPLQLSARSDGYAFSAIDYLGDDGLALGRYTLFDSADNDLGTRAFYFTPADGLYDLGSLIQGGMSLNGWSFLADAIREDGLGQIIGHGQQLSQSGGQMAYLLAPVLLGDFNHDDTVDAADYVVWRKGLGTTYNDADYNVWRANFGATAPTSSSIATTSVPEPTSCIVLLTLVPFAAIACRSRAAS
jgi:hypothetical protein